MRGAAITVYSAWGRAAAFSGTAVHDGWGAACAPIVAGMRSADAHHLREFTYIFEDFPAGVGAGHDPLVARQQGGGGASQRQGLTALPPSRRQAIDHAYQAVRGQALTADPQPPPAGLLENAAVPKDPNRSTWPTGSTCSVFKSLPSR